MFLSNTLNIQQHRQLPKHIIVLFFKRLRTDWCSEKNHKIDARVSSLYKLVSSNYTLINAFLIPVTFIPVRYIKTILEQNQETISYLIFQYFFDNKQNYNSNNTMLTLRIPFYKLRWICQRELIHLVTVSNILVSIKWTNCTTNA